MQQYFSQNHPLIQFVFSGLIEANQQSVIPQEISREEVATQINLLLNQASQRSREFIIADWSAELQQAMELLHKGLAATITWLKKDSARLEGQLSPKKMPALRRAYVLSQLILFEAGMYMPLQGENPQDFNDLPEINRFYILYRVGTMLQKQGTELTIDNISAAVPKFIQDFFAAMSEAYGHVTQLEQIFDRCEALLELNLNELYLARQYLRLQIVSFCAQECFQDFFTNNPQLGITLDN